MRRNGGRECGSTLHLRPSSLWQAAAGFDVLLLEVLVVNLRLIPAVTAAKPPAVSVLVPADHGQDYELAEAFALEVFGIASHNKKNS